MDFGVSSEGGTIMAIPFRIVNRSGSGYVVSSGVSATTEAVVYSFPAHSFASRSYLGSVYVELSQAVPAGAATTLPIVFETNGVQQAVTTYNGEALTVADLPGTGVYELWYNKQTNRLQIMGV